jgi:hypothetical protein
MTPPEDYAAAWKRMDEEYERRHRESLAQRIEGLLREHPWAGGFYCGCERPIGMPSDWGRHLLELALLDAED